MRRTANILLVLLVISISSLSQAESNRVLPFQGVITAGGSDISPDTPVTFLIYADTLSALGSDLWQQEIEVTPGTNNVVSVLLGTGDDAFDADLFDGSDRWLAIEIDGVELDERIRIGWTAYAFNATLLDGKSVFAFSDTTHSHELNGLDNVNVSGAANDEVLTYNESAGEWTPQAVSTGSDSVWEVNDPNIFRVNGNVGIGTNSPSVKLDVQGNVRTDSRLISTATSGAPMQVESSVLVENLNAEQLDGHYADAFADTLHNHELDDLGNVNVSGAANDEVLTYNESADEWTPQAVSTGSDSVWEVNDPNIFRVNGNVGIGTNSPSVKLDVQGNVRTDSRLISTATSGAPMQVESSVLVENLNAEQLDGHYADAFADTLHNHELDDLGNVNVSGAANDEVLTYNESADEWTPQAVSTGSDSVWEVNDPNISRVNGNVGIGTSNPDEKLDVDGNIRSSGSLYAGTEIYGSRLFIDRLIQNPDGTRGLSIRSSTEFTHGKIGGPGLVTTFDLHRGEQLAISPILIAPEDGTTSESGGLFVDGDNAAIWCPADDNVLIRFIDNTSWNLNDPDNDPYDDYATRALIDSNGVFHTFSPPSPLITNETTIINASAKVEKLRGVAYNFKEGGPQKALGLLANEVEDHVPEAVLTDTYGQKYINYSAFIPLLIEAIKEQKIMIEELRAELEALK